MRDNYLKTILPLFIGGNRRECSTARVENGIFYSYAVPVASFRKGKIYLARERFSEITASQQKAIREFAKANSIPLIECAQKTLPF